MIKLLPRKLVKSGLTKTGDFFRRVINTIGIKNAKCSASTFKRHNFPIMPKKSSIATICAKINKKQTAIDSLKDTILKYLFVSNQQPNVTIAASDKNISIILFWV